MKNEEFSPVSKDEEHVKITSYKEKASTYLQQQYFCFDWISL